MRNAALFDVSDQAVITRVGARCRHATFVCLSDAAIFAVFAYPPSDNFRCYIAQEHLQNQWF